MATVKLMSDFFVAPQKSAALSAAAEAAEAAAPAADEPIVLDEAPEAVAAARASPAAPSAPASAPAPVPAKAAATKADQAREAWAAIEKPVTEASFVRWYCATHNLKRSAAAEAAPAPAAKKQGLLPGAAPPSSAAAGGAASSALAKGKRTALVKGLMTSLKAAAKAKGWHRGDGETLTCTVVLDAADFAALLAGAGVALPASGASGVVTAFSLSTQQLAALLGEGLDSAVKVPTWSRPRAFSKSFKTGDALLSFAGADGKYSKGTSTLTLKCAARAGGGFDDEDAYGM